MKFLKCSVMVALGFLPSGSVAFLASPIPIQRCQQRQHSKLQPTQQQQLQILQQQQQQHPQHPLFMSSNFDEDELSKLIGRRDSIRKTKESSSASSTSPSSSSSNDGTENETIDLSTIDLSSIEGRTGMEVFEMPEFKTKRPVRIRKSDETNDASRSGGAAGSEGGSSQQKDDLYIDFQADYDDENDFHVPNRIGFGTMAWGDSALGFKAGTKLKKKEIKKGKFLAGDLQVAYNKLMEQGITFIDTSENYGLEGRKASLSSEQIIGRCMEENTEAAPILATTMSNPWKSLAQGTGPRIGRVAILKAIEASCERTGTGCIDLYQVPSRMFYLGAPGAVVDALAEALDQNLINHVGVCNMGKGSMRRFAKKLAKKKHRLTSNQFEFSLVNRKAWKSGLIRACKDLGVVPIAHTPLGGGLASGVYTAANPTGGQVSGNQPYDFDTLDKYDTLYSMLDTVQSKVKKRIEKENRESMDRRARYNGPPINPEVTTAQIAINYVVAKGCVPVPGIKNAAEAEELLGCLGWALTDEEVKMLDNAADMSDKGIKT